MQNRREVVISGAGVVTPLGITLDSFWESLLTGKSAIHQIELPASMASTAFHISEVTGYDPRDFVQPRKSIKLICQEIQFAFGAAMMACEHAQIKPGAIDPDRLSVCFGGELQFSDVREAIPSIRLCIDGEQFDLKRWPQVAMTNLYPLWMLKSLPNMAACHISIALDARGPINTVTSDEVSPLMAIHEAYHLLQRDAVDAVVVGASSSLTCATRLLQTPQEHFIQEQSDAPDAVKPFDLNRKGMARGQGAGCIILECAEHARKRGIKPLARLCSVASGFYIPKTYRQGSSRSISQTLDLALERAEVNADEIDHVNTNAGGSITLDNAIGNGVADVFVKVPAVAIQGGMGHLGASTGMVEFIASMVAAQDNGLSPYTVNFAEKDPKIRSAIQSEPGRLMQRPYVAKVSHTPHGQTAAIIAKLLDL